MFPGKQKRDTRNDCICVLAGRAEYAPLLPGRECSDKIHSHMRRWKAETLVAQGQAEWIKVKVFTRRGTERDQTMPAIRLIRHKDWRKVVSDPKAVAGGPMAVMQLV